MPQTGLGNLLRAHGWAKAAAAQGLSLPRFSLMHLQDVAAKAKAADVGLDQFLHFNTPSYGLSQNKIQISEFQPCVQPRGKENPDGFDICIRWLVVRISAWLVTKADTHGNKAVFSLLQDSLGPFEYAVRSGILN